MGWIGRDGGETEKREVRGRVGGVLRGLLLSSLANSRLQQERIIGHDGTLVRSGGVSALRNRDWTWSSSSSLSTSSNGFLPV